MQFFTVVLYWLEYTPYVAVVLLPATVEPLQSSVMFAAVTLKQVAPLVLTDWLRMYTVPADERPVQLPTAAAYAGEAVKKARAARTSSAAEYEKRRSPMGRCIHGGIKRLAEGALLLEVAE